jgi:hypothetical protein
MTHQGRTNRNAVVAIAATLMLLAVSALAQDSEIVLHAFTGGSHGAEGGTQLVSDSAGNLYGTTFAGGSKSTKCEVYTGLPGCGVVFELSPRAHGRWEERVLHTFTGGKDGAVPIGGVVLDSAGNLYGTTFFGGDKKPANCQLQSIGFAPGCGVVYKLSPTAHGPWEETILYTFTGGSDGAYPASGVILDSSGSVYGTAGAGGYMFACNPGGGGCGVVFKLTPTGQGPWPESILYAFTGRADGNQPLRGLTFDARGNLYGVTHEGGDPAVSCFGPDFPGCGVVFELTPTPSGPWNETVLYAFAGGVDGGTPLSNVILDSGGNVYGTTTYGGDLTAPNCPGGYGYDAPPGCGVVFELTPAGQGPWPETVLYAFTGGSDGAIPAGPLVFDTAGNLYGTTDDGGDLTTPNCQSTYLPGCGVVFELTPADNAPWTENVLYAFTDGADGGGPGSNLLFDSAGNLYGMNQYGGNASGCDGNGCGVVFELQQPRNAPFK